MKLPPTLQLLQESGAGNIGSLQSFHANPDAVTADPFPITQLKNPTEGSLPLFPRLDVMPGSASAWNDGLHPSSTLSVPSLNRCSATDLRYEEEHGALAGWRLGEGGDNPFVDVSPFSVEPLLPSLRDIIHTDAVDQTIAEARYGLHMKNPDMYALQQALNLQHSMGSSQQARDAGQEQFKNPANANQYPVLPNIPKSDPMTQPMLSPDDIQINNILVHASDTIAVGVQ